MIVTAPPPIMDMPVATPPLAAGAGARDLATGFLRYASGCWRGDRRAAVFPLRLGAYWRPELPPAPAAVPDAVSPHGGGGRGIQWYQTDRDVLGYVPGRGGGYQVPVREIPRLVRCAPVAR